MQKLNRIVWPAMEPMIRSRINESSNSIVVLDAAVLLEAGWHQMVHEIWVTFVPRDEAIRRIMERNKLTEQQVYKYRSLHLMIIIIQAIERIDAQMTNRDRIEYANVVLCSIWEYEKTAAQVLDTHPCGCLFK
jgi:phosphopantetheine adenylyltransferase/dephospho-CoA kinase